ncbi:unnamed protein product [Rangifer tarandus platyrhynchus]|uniref:Uncharacterized protein n=2 Tax=Rangifer tarandus platyrhynchus TaxID=3082113 RepID=A0ACB0DXD2_RANTA|nr:unnamed protein product [Rangifer tarandus platyrhynchus]CAI9692995.1 unnamed protein product [Rangifer tarandus platyrhynchus]
MQSSPVGLEVEGVASLGAPAPARLRAAGPRGLCPVRAMWQASPPGASVGAEEGADFLCGADDAPWVAGQRTLAGDEMPDSGGTSRQPGASPSVQFLFGF